MPDQPQQSQQASQGASNPGDAVYQRWLSQHPNAGAIEKDVMRKAFGAQQQAAPQSQQQVQPLQPLSNGQMPPAPEKPAAPKMAAMGRALGGPVS
jgi:hypothetical protein